MNRQDRRKRGDRSRREPKAAKFEYSHVTLRELRFETPEASRTFMNLRYFDDAYKGSTDGAVKLPPINESVSTTASSGGMVFKAFPHGLMYGDQLSLMGGVGVLVGLIWAQAFYFESQSGWGIFDLTKTNPFFVALIVILFMTILPLSLLTFIWDVTGYRFSKSPLFDRNAGRVHVFSAKLTSWLGNRHTLVSYDWACVSAEIDSMSVFTGTVGRSEVGLRCVVMDKPGGTEVVDRFSLGVNMPAHHIQPLLDTWEHVRRFMQHEGPLFADADDGPNPSLGKRPLWQYLWLFPGLFGGLAKDSLTSAWQEKSFYLLFMGLFVSFTLVIGFPLAAIVGLLPWISSLCKREPKWPAEILASVGGNALRGRDLQAWRNVVPQAPPGLEVDQRPALR